MEVASGTSVYGGCWGEGFCRVLFNAGRFCFVFGGEMGGEARDGASQDSRVGGEASGLSSRRWFRLRVAGLCRFRFLQEGGESDKCRLTHGLELATGPRRDVGPRVFSNSPPAVSLSPPSTFSLRSQVHLASVTQFTPGELSSCSDRVFVYSGLLLSSTGLRQLLNRVRSQNSDLHTSLQHVSYPSPRLSLSLCSSLT